MYILTKNKYKYRCDTKNIDGYIFGSNKIIKIKGISISNFLIVDKILIHNFVFKIVDGRYKKLIEELILLLSDDSDDGDVIALDHIEKFRLLIKNKYRKYLEEKEITLMSKKLQMLKKKAMKQLEEKNEYLKNIGTRSK